MKKGYVKFSAKNFPFAVHGYEFSRKDLKDYFSKFFWYYPKGKADVPGYEYETRTRIINEILEKRKKRKQKERFDYEKKIYSNYVSYVIMYS